jgi:outer membrane lipoprotein-sorting protein
MDTENLQRSLPYATDGAIRHENVTSLGTSARCLLVLAACVSGTVFAACNTTAPVGEKQPAATGTPASNAPDAEQIIKKYIAATDNSDSIMRLRARIERQSGSASELQMTITRKREADGRKLMLIEFTSPAEERDRDAVVQLTPDGEIEGSRYIQSSDSFATARGATNEDSLFGMTLQELADGQPEKYDFKLKGEETLESTAVYRVEGRLRPGAESKFPRLVMLISKENWIDLTSEFYDDHDELARRMTIRKVDQVNGRPMRLRWTVDNRSGGKRIDFEVLDAKHTKKIDSALFSREHLKKIASR